MILLVDSDVLLDYLLEREPFFSASNAVIERCSREGCAGYMALHGVAAIFYVMRKEFSPARRREKIRDLCATISFSVIRPEQILSALDNDRFMDFEDCLQMESAKRVHADYIITRNAGDYAASPIPALTPEDFLARN